MMSQFSPESGPKQLLVDDVLEQSGVVANCRMNRERVLTGSNGYSADLGFNPLDLLQKKASANGTANWLDLCCGSGRALIEAAQSIQASAFAGKIEIVGRKKRVTFTGCRQTSLPFQYLGADDQAGPNYTGQAVVDSHYEWLEPNG